MDAPEYPWGTEISLDTEQVEKFPELKDVSAGDELMAVIKVRVKRIQESETDDASGKEKRHSVDLQITDMDFDTAPAPVDAEKLYD